MNIDELVKRISKTDGLSKTLGMHFISTPEPDTLQASMKVDERNRQPFGFLSGGASLALAENVAGIGCIMSMMQIRQTIICKCCHTLFFCLFRFFFL